MFNFHSSQTKTAIKKNHTLVEELKEGAVKSGSTPVGGPDGNGRRRRAEAGQGFSPARVGTDWIQRQGDRALIPCIGSGQAETGGDRRNRSRD